MIRTKRIMSLALTCTMCLGLGIQADASELNETREKASQLQNQKKAAEDGYELEISDCVYDAWQNMRAAQVALKYHYRIPVLGIYEENITYTIAR